MKSRGSSDFFPFSPKRRFGIVVVLLGSVLIGIFSRLVYLTTIDRNFLNTHAEQQTTRLKILSARRGTIYDRNGIPLAVSTPMANVIFDPKQMLKYPQYWPKLANLPGISLSQASLEKLIRENPKNQFMYVAKGLTPAQGEAIKNLKIPGVYIENAPETFYPLGPEAAQIVGFTDVNNQGQDGLELMLDSTLKAVNGKALALSTAVGQTLAVTRIEKPATPGKDVYLSLDSHIQEAAYNALKEEVELVHADSASAIVIDPKTGEVLASATYPSFNPNDFNDRTGPNVRARPFTDSSEPASTSKLIVVTAALDSGKYQADSPTIDTSPGYYFLKGHRIRDDGDFGELTLTSIITKSSNVGISKVALSLPKEAVYQRYLDLGIGQNPGGGFPSTTRGLIHPINQIGDFVLATMSFGYGFSMSLAQIARMYATVADEGILRPLTLLKQTQSLPGKKIFKPETAKALPDIFRTVMEDDSTGLLANIPGYNVAGKTGTAKVPSPHGGYGNTHNALFVGFTPVQDPRIVVAVEVFNPKGHFNQYGGVSAAPIFAKIASAALRELKVPPTQKVIDLDLFHDQQKFFRAISNA